MKTAARRRPEAGFTLIEVMLAMAILGLTAVVLLQKRVEIVRDAARAKDLRTIWVLASQKMAELELNHDLWSGAGFQSNGDFGDVAPEYGAITWEYQIVPEPIDLSDPKDPKSDQKPRTLLRLTLALRSSGIEEPLVLEAEFPVYQPPPPAPDAKDAASGGNPSSAAGTPPTGTGGTPVPGTGNK